MSYRRVFLFFFFLFPIKEINALTLGNSNLPITVEYHFSFSCGECRNSFPKIFLPLKRDFIDSGKICFIFKAHALHPFDVDCLVLLDLATPSKRYQILEKIFTANNKFAQQINKEGFRNVLNDIAVEGGVSEFFAQIDSKENRQRVLSTCQENAKSGVEAIPQILINGKRFDGSYEELKNLLEKVLC